MSDQLDSIELEQAPTGPDGPERRRIPPAPTVIGILAVVALAVTALVLRPDGDVEVAVEETTTTNPTPTTDPGEGSGLAPSPIALGAPDDGMDSVGLPVSVEPASGLVDGQLVTVTGSGFPAGEAVGVVMCTREAGREHGARGVEACNIGHFAQADADAQGVAVVEFAVRRLLVLDGQEVDCASEGGRCIIGMGLLSDYDQSGGFALDFDPDAPLPPAPTVQLAKTQDIADGETVDAVVTGLLPHTNAFVMQCELVHGRCIPITEISTDGDGAFHGGIRLWRQFGTHIDPMIEAPPNVDCATVACQLRVEGTAPTSRAIPSVDLGFDPSRGKRTPPVVTIAEEGPYANGDRLTVDVAGASVGDFLDVQICSRDGHDCVGGGGRDVSADGTVRIEVRLELPNSGSSNPCASGCPLIVSSYPQQPDRTAPPSLVPDPIIITVTG